MSEQEGTLKSVQSKRLIVERRKTTLSIDGGIGLSKVLCPASGRAKPGSLLP